MKFKNYSERKNAAEQINKETGKITETFRKLGVDSDKVGFTVIEILLAQLLSTSWQRS